MPTRQTKNDKQHSSSEASKFLSLLTGLARVSKAELDEQERKYRKERDRTMAIKATPKPKPREVASWGYSVKPPTSVALVLAGLVWIWNDKPKSDGGRIRPSDSSQVEQERDLRAYPLCIWNHERLAATAAVRTGFMLPANGTHCLGLTMRAGIDDFGDILYVEDALVFLNHLAEL